jgi:hypothetical protein
VVGDLDLPFESFHCLRIRVRVSSPTPQSPTRHRRTP